MYSSYLSYYNCNKTLSSYTLLAKLADSCLVNVCHRASQSPPAACAVDSHSEAAMRVQ